MSLPKGFKRLEYIQSSGTQYVDTLFYPKYNSRVVVDVEGLGTSAGAVFGARNAAAATASLQFNVYRNSATTIRSDYFGTNASMTISDASARTTIDKNANIVTLFGSTITNTAVSSGECTYSLYLFALNSVGSASVEGSFKLYSCQCYDAGTLVRDFIPCQNADGEIGLWDDVNGVFYGNAGTGTFTAGSVVPERVDESEITELEYIQSSGTQYFDTRFAPNQSTRVLLDVHFPAQSAAAWLFGARHANTDRTFGFLAYESAYRSDYNASTVAEAISTVPGKRFVLDKNQNVTKFDGVVERMATAGTFQSDYTLYLFANNNAGTVGAPGTATLYSGLIFDNGLLERDFIPVILSNGEVGLYDRVFHEFYRNAGTGEFIAGPEMVHEDYTELEYIESDGTQYVNTLFMPNQDTRAVLDFQYTDTSAISWLFGVQPSWGNAMFDLAMYANSSAMHTGYGTQAADMKGLTDKARSIVDKNKNLTTIDGITNTATANSFQTEIPAAIFAVSRSTGFTDFAKMILYSCRIYDNGTEVRIYVPKLHPSGVAGLWDSVNERFYASATTTDFIAGPEAQTVPKAPANFRVESESDTLVTLAWDASEEVLGYRLYRLGQLLADTTETSVSVTVEPFAGAVFQLTAYNENGEGAATELTYFNVQEDPILFLITDRTQQDVAEQNPKGYYAASDLNRVGYAMDYLADIIRGYGYDLEVDTKTDWTDEGWKLTGEMLKYLQSLNHLKAVFSTLVELPETMEKIDYQDANNIELLLLTIDETIVRVVAGFTRANAYGLYSGAKGLPASQSDRGRNWGQLDALETTWANWQLATWYLLLYGNLKAEGVVE